ncbi:hypothetical protein [Streptomyces pseudogriseolus]|uniref:hypothetical protein n=1 Tax=Streptomyces pseudogriseolus TaxID=36817 RepID=UPI003FA21570
MARADEPDLQCGSSGNYLWYLQLDAAGTLTLLWSAWTPGPGSSSSPEPFAE